MKKLCTTLVAVLAIIQISYGQWTTTGTNISNSNTGNVGIKTTSPTSPLSVVGSNGGTNPGNTAIFSSNLGSSSSVGNQVNITNSTNWGLLLGFDGSGVSTSTYHAANASYVINVLNGPLNLGANNAPNVTILPTGYVGIGTTAPSAKLDVQGGSASIYNTGGSTSLGIGSPATGKTMLALSTSADASGYGNIESVAVGGSTWGNTIINQHGGYLGVATNAPTYPLDVNGVIYSRNELLGNLGVRVHGIPGDNINAAPWYGVGQSNITFTGSTSTATQLAGYFGLNFQTSAGQMVMLSNGFVGIGTTQPDAALAVNGSIHATQVKVTATVPGPDYVFDNDYKLITLAEIKDYIAKNHRLPEVPSAEHMSKEGIDLGNMNLLLLKKVEELTLYLIDKDAKLQSQKKQIEDQNRQLNTQREKSEQQEARIDALEKALTKLISNK